MEKKRDLVSLYESLGNLKYDFRNYNLNNLVMKRVKGNSVVDIGCGAGFLLNKLEESGKKVYGIEPDEEMIGLAEKLNPGLEIIKGKAEDVDRLIREKADTITMTDVLEHIENDFELIKKLHGRINDDGKLIIVVPAIQFLYGIRDRNNKHCRRYSKKRLIRMLKQGGFKIKEIRYWNMLGFFPYLFYEKILRKPLYPELRTKKEKNFFKKLMNKMLNSWFKNIENNFSFGFGLSLIAIGER